MIESARRRDTFDPDSLPVRLADGQEWWIAPPGLEIHPVFQDGRLASHWETLGYGPPINALIEAISQATDPGARLSGVLSLAGILLRWNYNLSAEEVRALLTFEPAALAPAIERIMAITTGQDSREN